MRIISKATVNDFVGVNPKSRKELTIWVAVTELAAWQSIADVKATFGHRVDFVSVASGATVAVFDIRNNDWRLIAAVHFVETMPIKGRVYVLRILTHKEYDTNGWKQEL
jgi:mRNA interferase HigB